MHIKKSLIVFICLIQILSGQGIEVELVRSFEAGFNFPTDICGNDDGEVFVLDAVNDRIVVLKATGVSKEIIPQRDSFYKAVGIAWIDDELWVADTPRSRLLRLEMSGRISKVIKLDHGTEPVDLVSVGENKAITDRLNHSVTVLDKNDKEKYYWGKRGDRIGEFINPAFLVTGPDDRLIIADMLNRRVMSFSQSGRFPQVIAKPGVEQGQVFRPKGLALDSENQVWIADGYTGSIQIFSSRGEFIGVVKAKGKVLSGESPMGIWLDKQDRLWMVESLGNKVSVWQKK